jgi:predicted dehydrogenase
MTTNHDAYVPGALALDEAFGDAYAPPLVNGRRIRLGIIGTGSMGMEHIEAALAVGGADIAGVFDSSAQSLEVARKRFDGLSGARTYASAAALCCDEAIDAVVVATPNHTHFEVVRTAMEGRKHILLEKPVTHLPEDAMRLVEVTRGYEPVVYVGFECREKPVYQEVMREVHERRSLGDPKMVYLMEHRAPFLAKKGQWNKFSRCSGGTLVEKCCHYFDLFRQILNSNPVKVYASGGMDVNFRDFEYAGERADVIDNAFVVVDFANGTRACLNLSMFVMDQREELSVCGSRATLYAQDALLSKVIVTRNPLTPGRETSIRVPDRIAVTGNHGGSTYYEHVRFINAIAGRDRSYPTVIDGMWAVIMGAAGEESIQTGKPIVIAERYGVGRAG